jgi:DNA-directed RNA polymerase specialized sigma24 family protein
MDEQQALRLANERGYSPEEVRDRIMPRRGQRRPPLEEVRQVESWVWEGLKSGDASKRDRAIKCLLPVARVAALSAAKKYGETSIGDRDDVAQTLIHKLLKYNSFDPAKGRLGALITAIAYNAIKDILRKSSRVFASDNVDVPVTGRTFEDRPAVPRRESIIDKYLSYEDASIMLDENEVDLAVERGMRRNTLHVRQNRNREVIRKNLLREFSELDQKIWLCDLDELGALADESGRPKGDLVARRREIREELLELLSGT